MMRFSLCGISCILLMGFHLSAWANTYAWYWGGDVMTQQYTKYCQAPGINEQCEKTCQTNHHFFPNKGQGKGNGQAYCKQLPSHYKLWCSCDTSSNISHPACPIYPLQSPANTFTLIEGDTATKCDSNCEVYSYSLNTKGNAAGVCLSKGQVLCQCNWFDEKLENNVEKL